MTGAKSPTLTGAQEPTPIEITGTNRNYRDRNPQDRNYRDRHIYNRKSHKIICSSRDRHPLYIKGRGSVL
jgi:hypothetical protein